MIIKGTANLLLRLRSTAGRFSPFLTEAAGLAAGAAEGVAFTGEAGEVASCGNIIVTGAGVGEIPSGIALPQLLQNFAPCRTGFPQ